ncbi:MAG TPA: hypothetical protein VND43_06240 [Burkholderiales bacterium]|nr:hypothetical protein [Burkholderiales bacterium]
MKFFTNINSVNRVIWVNEAWFGYFASRFELEKPLLAGETRPFASESGFNR